MNWLASVALSEGPLWIADVGQLPAWHATAAKKDRYLSVWGPLAEKLPAALRPRSDAYCQFHLAPVAADVARIVHEVVVAARVVEPALEITECATDLRVADILELGPRASSDPAAAQRIVDALVDRVSLATKRNPEGVYLALGTPVPSNARTRPWATPACIATAT